MNRMMLGLAVGLVTGASATAVAQVYVKVPTNGILRGYIVQKNGKTVCKNPEVSNEFRGPDSYILCP